MTVANQPSKQPSRQKLAAYLAAGAGAFGVADQASAVIVTHTPNTTGTPLNGTIELDFDGVDGPEFIIKHSLSKDRAGVLDLLELKTGPDGMNHMYVKQNPLIPKALKFGAKVGGAFNMDFAATLHRELDGNEEEGQFHGPIDAYLGLKWDKGGTTFLGWANIVVNSPATSPSAGFNSAGGPINAGQTAVPEPSSIALLAGGALGLAALRRRNRKRAR